MESNQAIDKERIIKSCGIIPERIWNIYMYGSRVYGTNRPNSDYDFLVVASCLDRHKELHDGEYNIHIWTIDAFIDNIWKYEMGTLECHYAPSFAVLQNKMPINFVPNSSRMRNAALTQSHRSWINGKMKLRECDILRGQKSIFHSLRILDFASQILANGKIVNFSSMNYIWDEIDKEGEPEWDYYKRRYFPLKLKLEHEVKRSPCHSGKCSKF